MTRLAFLLLFSLLVSASVHAQETEPAGPVLRLEAELPKDEISPEEFIKAKVKLTNAGKESVKLGLMTCTKMDNWMTNGGQIVIAEEKCESDAPLEKELAPGESLEDEIGLLVSGIPAETEEPFRIGFRTGSQPDIHYAWSEPVQLKILDERAPST